MVSSILTLQYCSKWMQGLESFTIISHGLAVRPSAKDQNLMRSPELRRQTARPFGGTLQIQQVAWTDSAFHRSPTQSWLADR